MVSQERYMKFAIPVCPYAVVQHYSIHYRGMKVLPFIV